MTKKHYIALADLIAQYPSVPIDFINGLTKILKEDNPEFSLARFRARILDSSGRLAAEALVEKQ